MAMNLGGGKGPKKPISDINVTPLVDVMLVLLIIFIIVTPAMKENVDVDLPAGKGQTVEAEPDDPMSVVTMDKNHVVHAGSTAVALADVNNEFPRLYRGQGRKTITLRAHRDLTHGDIVRVLSALKSAGVETIRVEVDPREDEAK